MFELYWIIAANTTRFSKNVDSVGANFHILLPFTFSYTGLWKRWIFTRVSKLNTSQQTHFFHIFLSFTHLEFMNKLRLHIVPVPRKYLSLNVWGLVCFFVALMLLFMPDWWKILINKQMTKGLFFTVRCFCWWRWCKILLLDFQFDFVSTSFIQYDTKKL